MKPIGEIMDLEVLEKGRIMDEVSDLNFKALREEIVKRKQENFMGEIKRKQSKNHELDCRYMRMAMIWAENSYAIRRKVGCLIVKNNMIISDGYNGMPSGFPNVCEDYRPPHLNDFQVSECREEVDIIMKEYPGTETRTKDEVLHAEANAITKLARSGNSSDGATLYVTCEPCLDCAKLIIQAGIIRVCFHESYHTHEGVRLLVSAGIIVQHLKDLNIENGK